MSAHQANATLLQPRSNLLPTMYACHQQLYTAPLGDAGTVQAVRDQFAAQGWAAKVAGGKSVAITCGSRGIDRIDLVIRTLVELVQQAGGDPFVFPAMGSHGGTTGPGQTAVLATLGVTEASIGCPIRSSLQTVTLGHTDAGLPVYLDQHASRADAILVVNRVKPHTSFVAPVESGLMKMLAIGMGKADQAVTIHALGIPGLRDQMPAVARVVLQKAPVIGGLAILEDALHQVTRIEGLAPQTLEQQEQGLLAECRSWQAGLPVDQLDLLIVDEIGKEISGTGMDSKVVGRCRLLDFHAFAQPQIKVIAVLGLTAATAGNAVGIGMADITTRRVAEGVDRLSTYRNGVISHSPAMAAMPVTVETDAEAIRTALDYLCNPKPIDQIRVIRIRNTLQLANLEVSQPVAQQLNDHPTIRLSPHGQPMTFTPEGRLWPLRNKPAEGKLS